MFDLTRGSVCRLSRNFLVPFKNIKDVIRKMTRYSVANKDKRNGTELWPGKTGLNMRKNFLTAKVLNTEKGNQRPLGMLSGGLLKSRIAWQLPGGNFGTILPAPLAFLGALIHPLARTRHPPWQTTVTLCSIMSSPKENEH